MSDEASTEKEVHKIAKEMCEDRGEVWEDIGPFEQYLYLQLALHAHNNPNGEADVE